ncbi:MAG: GTP cyclohydrolase-2 [Alphaproteobacteria bacterium]|nr:MAG: GTP cyclohydrolase-2 [Alphaproteobacteria bacterium]
MTEQLARPAPADPAEDSAILTAVDRATAELRRGAMVLLVDRAGRGALVLAAETAGEETLTELAGLAGPARLALAIGVRRAAVLGFPGGEAGGIAAIAFDPAQGSAVLRRLADPTQDGGATHPLAGAEAAEPQAARFAAAAVELVKLARLLPAAILAPLGDDRRPADPAGMVDWARRRDLLAVSEAAVAGYQSVAARSLRRVGEARVPLEGAENARIIAFRPVDGGIEHLAILIGEPAPHEPVLARLHSECFTGDLLGSLRCDCGEQLRGAIAAIGRQGSGLLLYLAQEGRGIGLVNKLRAYELQDRGADTVEANRQLGFDPDERIYQPAAEMLRQLGFDRVRLMTNNPEKVAGLARCGITVTERVPHVIPANGHNEGYLRTKAARLGHMF